MRCSKKTRIAAVLAILGVVGVAIGYHTILAPPFEMAWAAAQPVQDLPPGATIVLTGLVEGPDGAPAVGANVAAVSQYPTSFGDGKSRAVTASDGRFSIKLPRAELANHLASGEGVNLLATAPRRGMAWGSAADFLSEVDRKGLGSLAWVTARPPGDPILRLTPDDHPVSGRIIDAKGKPASGARISLQQVWSNDRGDLGPWATAIGDGQEFGTATRQTLDRWISGPGLWGFVTTTGPDGSFRLADFGRGRLVALKVIGPTVSCTTLLVRTDGGPAVSVNNLSSYLFPQAQGCFGGDDLSITVGRSRPVEGVVRDIETGDPVVGAVVQSHKFAGAGLIGNDALSARTDAAGQFHLEGLTTGPDNMLLVRTPDEQPYLPRVVDVSLAEGEEPVTVEIPVRRGVWAEGRVTDAADGRSLLASIDYFAARDNPNLARYPRFEALPLNGMMYRTDGDGRFRVPVMPGRGILAARVLGPSRWFPGAGAKTSQAGRTYACLGDRVQALGEVDQTGSYASAPGLLYTGNYHQVASIAPADGEARVTADLKISR